MLKSGQHLEHTFAGNCLLNDIHYLEGRVIKLLWLRAIGLRGVAPSSDGWGGATLVGFVVI